MHLFILTECTPTVCVFGALCSAVVFLRSTIVVQFADINKGLLKHHEWVVMGDLLFYAGQILLFSQITPSPHTYTYHKFQYIVFS